MDKKRYPAGLYFNEPRQGAPDFVKGSIAIKKEALMTWLDSEQPNDKGYIYLDVLNGTDKETGQPKPYVVVNEYKKDDRINFQNNSQIQFGN